MVDQGLIKAEGPRPPQKNIILRSLGPEPHASEAAGPFPIFRGDIFMLCSDGLSVTSASPRWTATWPGTVSLPRDGGRAKRRGGKDNITIRCSTWCGERLSDPRPGDKPAHAGASAAGSGVSHLRGNQLPKAGPGGKTTEGSRDSRGERQYRDHRPRYDRDCE